MVNIVRFNVEILHTQYFCAGKIILFMVENIPKKLSKK